MSYPGLSVCMIVKDEEKNLPRALSSIQGLADELIVVDTGSKDRTVEIARSFGAKVYFFRWCDDFAKARNESLKYATKDYILWFDADDEFEAGKKKELKKALRNHFGKAFYLRIILQRGDYSEECYQIRVFPNRRGILFEGRIHEQPNFSIKRLKIPVLILDTSIIHHGYNSEEAVLKKLERNKRILEETLRTEPENSLAHFFYGKTLLGLKEEKGAFDYLRKFIELAKKDGDLLDSQYPKIAFMDIFTMLSKNGENQSLKSFIKEYEDLFGEDFISSYFSAHLLLLEENYEEALKRLDSAEQSNFRLFTFPVNHSLLKARLRARKAFCLSKLKRVGEARTYIDLSLEDAAKDGEVFDLLADSCVILKDPHRLLTVLERFEGENGKYHYLKGFAELLKGDHKSAKREFERAIEKNYHHKNCYLCLSISCRAIKAFDDAIDYLERYNLFAKERDITRELALLYLEKGDFEKAKELVDSLKEDESFETKAFSIYLKSLNAEWEDMLFGLAELAEKLFPKEGFSLEKILKIEKILLERGEERAGFFVGKSISHFLELSPF